MFNISYGLWKQMQLKTNAIVVLCLSSTCLRAWGRVCVCVCVCAFCVLCVYVCGVHACVLCVNVHVVCVLCVFVSSDVKSIFL